jgi:hypothetical protein
MKTFLKKIFYFFLALFLIIGTSTFFLYRKTDLSIKSNSIALNAKESFIFKNKNQINNCKFFVIGSSMSLNNIDCILLSKSLDQKIINLSSWGMKFKDFEDFNIWNKSTTVLININFIDFGKSGIKIYPNYFPTFINVLKNNNLTYIGQLIEYKKNQNIIKNNFYNTLKFDESGSVIFCEKKDFKIDSNRWNNNIKDINESEIQDLVNDIKAQSKTLKKIIITFSPCRRVFYNLYKSSQVKRLNEYLKLIPNVIFLNNYDIEGFFDDDFVDKDHFSRQGAEKYTQLISEQINSELNKK